MSYLVVVGGPSTRLPAPSPMIEEGEIEEVRVSAEARVAELAARGQNPSPATFYDWLKLLYGHRYVISCGNAVRTDPQERSALEKRKKNFVSMIFFLQAFLLPGPGEGPAIDWRREEVESSLREAACRGLQRQRQEAQGGGRVHFQLGPQQERRWNADGA